jgi:hypothetical protein
MIDENIKIHDQYSFEIKLGYKPSREEVASDYQVDTYLFIPDSLDINQQTYNKKDFYNDLKIYVRFITPICLLKDILNCTIDPYNRLKKACDILIRKGITKNILQFEFHVKMFCSIFSSSLSREIFHIKRNRNSQDANYLVQDFVENVSLIKKQYRELRKILNVSTINQQHYLIYLFGDEFISNTTEKYLFTLFSMIQQNKVRVDESQKESVIAAIENVSDYRKQQGYLTPNEDQSNEELIYRRNVLKKYIQNVLFLNTRYKTEGKLVEHVLFGIAAGVSMLFATAVVFYVQKKYGNFTLPLFMTLIFSYMFKDRIKAIFGAYFKKFLRGFYSDKKTNFYSDRGQKVGYYQENTDYVSEKSIPTKIKKLRNRQHITDIENNWMGEKILLYQKRTKLYSKNFNNVFQDYEITGVNDISRINVQRFTQKMDNPKTKTYLLKNQEKKTLNARRVYHINIIMKFHSINDSFYKRYRMVLNRDGIKRIEKVSEETVN